VKLEDLAKGVVVEDVDLDGPVTVVSEDPVEVTTRCFPGRPESCEADMRSKVKPGGQGGIGKQ
jgi:hypothetical protein